MIIGSEKSIGAKAYNLIKLQEKGICVPRTVVLANDMCEFIDGLIKKGSGIDEIYTILGKKHFFDFENEMDYPFIIRSSSSDEDDEKKSNAGKYMSIYNCRSRVELINYVIKCWNSKSEDKSMGVIIQEQVFPYCSGVAFISEKDDEISLLVECVIGLGELLVSGYVTPSAFLYDSSRDDFTLINRTTQRVAEFPVSDSTLVPTDDFSIGEHTFRVLNLKKNVFYALCDYEQNYWDQSPKILKLLKEECLKIYNYFGSSDIEWVYGKNKKIYIVQRRPITKKIDYDDNISRDRNTKKNIGTTIVSGKAVGKLVSLNEYKGENDVIVFANMFMPKDIIKVSNALGIMSVECSLLSHCSILAREYGLPYWAGVDAALYEKNKGCIVDVDFEKKVIKTTNTIKQKSKLKNVDKPFAPYIYDPISMKCIPEEEKEKYTVYDLVKDKIAKYYDVDFIERVWGDV